MKCFFLTVLSLSVSCTLGFAQILVNSFNLPVTLDFSTYTAAGFDNSGTAGFLDTDNWQTEGINGVADSTTWGQSKSGAKYARGEGTGGTNSGGLWSFDVSNGGTLNRTLGVNPNINASDVHIFVPGALELRFENQTGSTINAIDFAYDLFIFNDKNSAYKIDFAVDGANQASVSHTTDAGKDSNPVQWVQNQKSGSVLGLNWTVGSHLIFRWDVGEGPGNDVDENRFDEIAFDNISITAIPEPSTYALMFGGLAIAIVIFAKRRAARKVS